MGNLDYGTIYDLNDLDDFDDYDDFDLEAFLNGEYSIDESDNEKLYDTVVFDNGSIIEIRNALKIKDANGDPALAVDFHWENNSGKKSSAMWDFGITASQNGKLLTITWPASNDPDVDMTNYSKDVAAGDKIDFQVVFKLANESDPVSVMVKDMVSGSSEKAGCTFTIK